MTRGSRYLPRVGRLPHPLEGVRTRDECIDIHCPRQSRGGPSALPRSNPGPPVIFSRLHPASREPCRFGEGTRPRPLRLRHRPQTSGESRCAGRPHRGPEARPWRSCDRYRDRDGGRGRADPGQDPPSQACHPPSPPQPLSPIPRRSRPRNADATTSCGPQVPIGSAGSFTTRPATCWTCSRSSRSRPTVG